VGAAAQNRRLEPIKAEEDIPESEQIRRTLNVPRRWLVREIPCLSSNEE